MAAAKRDVLALVHGLIFAQTPLSFNKIYKTNKRWDFFENFIYLLGADMVDAVGLATRIVPRLE